MKKGLYGKYGTSCTRFSVLRYSMKVVKRILHESEPMIISGVKKAIHLMRLMGSHLERNAYSGSRVDNLLQITYFVITFNAIQH
jgi:hypothetical protein